MNGITVVVSSGSSPGAIDRDGRAEAVRRVTCGQAEHAGRAPSAALAGERLGNAVDHRAPPVTTGVGGRPAM